MKSLTPKELTDMMGHSDLLDMVDICIHFDVAREKDTFLIDLEHLIKRYMSQLSGEEKEKLNDIIEKVITEKNETVLKVLQEAAKAT